MGCAIATIGLANLLKLPIATSQATVGALIGYGILKNSVFWTKVFIMIGWWLATPIIALFASYFIGKFLHRDQCQKFIQSVRKDVPHSRLMVRLFLTGTGCYMAFSAGANGLAKAVGPMVG